VRKLRKGLQVDPRWKREEGRGIFTTYQKPQEGNGKELIVADDKNKGGELKDGQSGDCENDVIKSTTLKK